ncbi:hypothetical protein CHARACLAT_026314, partial [Characodon lateralis]|nr:hypothetical protein [Characodon lateralis]
AFHSIISVTTWEVLEEQEEPETQQMSEPKEEPGPQPIKQEHIQLLICQDELQLFMKQETNTFMVTSAYQKIFHNVPEVQQIIEINEKIESVQNKEETEPVKIKKEPEHVKIEDFCSNQDEDQLTVKQETDSLMVTPAYEQKDKSEPEPNKSQK